MPEEETLKDTELTEAEAELYDRQIRLWGLDSQKRLRASNILICGLNGLGAEVAKNIILAGVKSVTLLDSNNVTESDSCSQFLAPVTSIGKNRADESLLRAQALNNMVEIKSDPSKLSDKPDSFFHQFDVIVIIEGTTEKLIRINNICRLKNINFFSGDVWGLFGYSFTDLQEHEYVEDVAKHKIISKPNEKPKTELVYSTVKRTASFGSFADIMEFDYNSTYYKRKIKHNGPAYIVFRILQSFRDTEKRDPCYKTREEDIKLLIDIRNKMAPDLVDDAELINIFSQISPAAGIVGGALAHEIIKAVSQKESPHRNMFFLDPNRVCGFIDYFGK